jgi:hypothetical protein
MLSINGSTTQWVIPSIKKTVADCFPFLMAVWQLSQTKKKLYNMIHNTGFT